MRSSTQMQNPFASRCDRVGPDVILEGGRRRYWIASRLPEPQGIGLRLMSHGAALIGAEFNVSRNPGRRNHRDLQSTQANEVE